MRLCIPYLAFLLVVNAIHNVTVDDNDPSIIYQPPDSWVQSVYDVLDTGGRHHVTSDPSATASFTFTGVAIYFYSPLWTFSVTTQVALDDFPAILLDLRDYTQPFEDNGPETVASSVVWSQTDLADTQHTLLVSVGSGETLAILDALVYTVLDPGDMPSSSSSPSSSSTSSTSTLPSSTSIPNPSTASESSSRKGLAVTLVVVCTVFGLLVVCGIWWFIRRRQKHGDDHDNPRTINDDIHSPEMSNTTAAYYSTYPRGRDRFRSIPTGAAAVSNEYGKRRSRPSSAIRHTAVTPSKMKNPLTTIPEAPLREMSLARHSTRSPVQDRRRESLPSPRNNNGDVQEETWTYPHPVKFASVT